MLSRSVTAFALLFCAGLTMGCGEDAPRSFGEGGADAVSTTGAGGTGGGTGGSGGAACEPKDETCNGLDDNCDGAVDEGCGCTNGQAQACYSGAAGTQGVGPCAAGTQTCDLAGAWGPCQGEVVPGAESCNGADDDCNGAADDMGTLTCGVGGCAVTVAACTNGVPGDCVPTLPTLEICDGIDNNCNQLLDESYPNAGAACDSGLLGVCQPGTNQCVTGPDGVTAATCVASVAPLNETCDGADNDCNGSVDDSVPGTGGACDTGLLGPCAAGIIDCQGASIDCYSLTPPITEVCDAVDNDCNGVVDDPAGAGSACSTGLLGVCGVGVMTCQGAAFGCVQQQQAIATDTCGDALDNDCDGTVDEGCLYTFAGVANNVPIANLTGWTQCYVGNYGASASLSTLLAQCSKANLLLGCRTSGSSTLTVAAHAPRADVTFETGSSQTPHNGNGVGWYYTSSYSWGFAPQGSPINRNSCDIVDSQSYPGGGAADGDKRICWHTSSSTLASGWRCGKPDFLGATHERLIFHAD
jgi:hypothetical protein